LRSTSRDVDGAASGVPALDFGGIRGAKKREYITAVQATLSRDYDPMIKVAGAWVHDHRRKTPKRRESFVARVGLKSRKMAKLEHDFARPKWNRSPTT
jgi:hypothetical protein